MAPDLPAGRPRPDRGGPRQGARGPPPSATALAGELRRSLRTARQDTLTPSRRRSPPGPSPRRPAAPQRTRHRRARDGGRAGAASGTPARRPGRLAAALAPSASSRRWRVVAALVAGAVGGALAAPSDEDPPPPPAVVGSNAVPAGPLALTAPADWTSAEGQPTDTRDLPLDGAVTLRPPEPTRPRPSSPGCRRRPGPGSSRPRSRPARASGWSSAHSRPCATRPPGSATRPATLHVVPTSAGVATVACLGDAAGGDGDLAATCDAMAASLRLRAPPRCGLDPDPRYAAALGRSLDRVDAALARLAEQRRRAVRGAQGDRPARRPRRGRRAARPSRRRRPAAGRRRTRPRRRAGPRPRRCRAWPPPRTPGRPSGWVARRRAATTARQRLDDALEQLDAAGYRTVRGDTCAAGAGRELSSTVDRKGARDLDGPVD